MTTPLREKMIRDLKILGRSESTTRNYVGIIIDLAKYYHRSPDELRDDDIQTYLYYLVTDRDYSANSLNIAAWALRFFYHTTLKRSKMEFIIPTSKKATILPSIFSRQEIDRLLDHTETMHDKALLMTAYASGLRVSEVVNLKVADIDSTRMVIHIRNAKGNRDRMGALAKNSLEPLRDYWKQGRPRDWFFPSRVNPNQHISENTARKIFKAAMERAGIRKPCRFHSLRHSFATHLLEAGKDIKKIQRLMGHRSLTSTLVYIHLANGAILTLDSPLDIPPEDPKE